MDNWHSQSNASDNSKDKSSTSSSGTSNDNTFLNFGGSFAAESIEEYVGRRDDLPFPDTIDELKSLKDHVQIDDTQPPCFTFAKGNNKFCLAIATFQNFLNSTEGRLSEVDLSLPENDPPDLKGKTRKEILEILASNVGADHEKLLEALSRNNIQHTVSSYTKNIFVKNCDWDTLVKISNLVNELKCDLTISGGSFGEYLANPAEPSECSTETKEYQDKITSSCLTHIPVRAIKVGVIDSGCSSSLRNKLDNEGKVFMYGTMIDPSNETFYDGYNEIIDGRKFQGHGTGVVEIIANCVVKNTEIYVASLGSTIQAEQVEDAIMKLFELDVEIINCSFLIRLDSGNLIKTLKKLKSTEKLIIVAAAGNDKSYSIRSLLNDGGSIMVGSHDVNDVISKFSTGKCKANVCSLGEGVYIQSVTPNVRDGTSFAAPHVTAVLVNLLSHLPNSPNEENLRTYLKNAAGSLFCHCAKHKGQSYQLKLDAWSIMQELPRIPVGKECSLV